MSALDTAMLAHACCLAAWFLQSDGVHETDPEH